MLPLTVNPNAAWKLWDAAERRPDHPAILTRDAEVTWARLAARAGAFAQTVDDAGTWRGERVAILLDRGADAAAAFYGVLATGAIAVQVNPTLRPRQIEHILRHSGARLLIADPALLERLPRPLHTKATILDLRRIPEAIDHGPARLVASDPAHIIYTSGSTGLPKGVTISHGNVTAGAEAVSTYLELRPDDRLASVLPFTFDYGLNQLTCAVHNAATLVVERSPIALRIAASLEELQVTVLGAVPPLWMQLLQVKRFHQPIESLRVLTNTGGKIPVPAVRQLRRAQPQARLFLMYGLTEAFRSTYLEPEEVDQRPDSIGDAIPGAEILVVDEHGRECPPGVEGELVHRGPTVALGYWNDPLATATVFRPHPLRAEGAPDAERVVFSGDRVVRDEDGYLYFVSRGDRMIKTLGYRVSPDEVVDGLHASGQVAEAVVVAEEDEQAGTCIVAHLVLAPDGNLETLQGWCREELPRYMQPARFEVHAELPRTTSGKHDARALAREGRESAP